MSRIFQTRISSFVTRYPMAISGILVLSLVVLATGCSSSATVSGKVTYQEKPLTGGTIMFTSTQGKGSRKSDIAEDGSYTITKMPTGPAKISVETQSAQPPLPTMGAQPNVKPPKGVELPPEAAKSGLYGEGKKKSTAVKIPDDYADPDKSGLEYTVTSGSQTKNIELK